jgi:hypothetical protein
MAMCSSQLESGNSYGYLEIFTKSNGPYNVACNDAMFLYFFNMKIDMEFGKHITTISHCNINGVAR